MSIFNLFKSNTNNSIELKNDNLKNQKKLIDKMIFQEIHNSRGKRVSVKEIAELIDNSKINYPFPHDLVAFMDNKYSDYTTKKILEIYIRHEKYKIINEADLNKAKKLGVKKVKIRTCQDSKVCNICKKHANKSYDINSAPQLPLCWECRCYYEPQIK